MLEVAEQGLVVAELLVDVLLEVGGERRPERLVQPARLGERGLRQGYGRADDLVLQDEVVGPQVP